MINNMTDVNNKMRNENIEMNDMSKMIKNKTLNNDNTIMKILKKLKIYSVTF